MQFMEGFVVSLYSSGFRMGPRLYLQEKQYGVLYMSWCEMVLVIKLKPFLHLFMNLNIRTKHFFAASSVWKLIF